MYFDWRNRIGIFYRTREWAEEKCREISNEIPQDAIQTIMKSSGSIQIILKDGSDIHFVQAHENSRGQKFDKIYCQDGINEEFINVVVRHTCQPVRIINLDTGETIY